jgi:predicted transcriptional regulator
MHPRCESVALHLLPAFRFIVAKELIEKYNFTQVATAKKLGVTQAAISQYIHSKRGGNYPENFKKFVPLVKKAAYEAANCLASEDGLEDEAVAVFCRLCRTVARNK